MFYLDYEVVAFNYVNISLNLPVDRSRDIEDL